MVRELYPKIDIEVDGGLKPATIDHAARAGANMIVSGSGVFKVGGALDVVIRKPRRRP